MKNLTHRQNLILEFIRENGKASTKEIKKYLEKSLDALNRITIIRDLEVLIDKKIIDKTGQGRGVSYKLKIDNPLMSFYNPDEYFKQTLDQRKIKETFNFEVFQYFNNSIFLKEELNDLDEINNDYQKRIKKLSPTIIKKEFERLTIELSWKSSKIEGNTYSLIDTEVLIKENKEASGKTKEEAQMILNHKKALDYILDKPGDFKELTLDKIENLHQLIIADLGIEKNIRKKLVGITGTNYKPLDNEFQIKEAMEKMFLVVNSKKLHPILRALSVVTLISYIQPFGDGNKRTARLLGNAILLAQGYCPLSYRSIDEKDYKKATLLFYEQNSICFLKKLFIQQFKFSINNYFLANL